MMAFAVGAAQEPPYASCELPFFTELLILLKNKDFTKVPGDEVDQVNEMLHAIFY